MQKLLKIFTIVMSCLFFFPASVNAQLVIADPAGDRFKDVVGIINNFSALIRPIAILAFLAMIIYGGFTKLTAAGDADKEKQAMMIIQAAIVGFVIIVLAPLIVEVVGTLLNVQTISSN